VGAAGLPGRCLRGLRAEDVLWGDAMAWGDQVPPPVRDGIDPRWGPWRPNYGCSWACQTQKRLGWEKVMALKELR